ncbi:LCCL domain-containing protein [Wenxinia marina]|uniref:LCCL domain protein n=1 Tax=Wenxinia marina DSM 24838 TaxID=1123501 RepID=A0A0D0PDL4_9RHOB|nr:LCCL domain-containing protein [Wenxinia marina]KIQ69546.1 LCCL domain protein [Wenxinia marina DSM 24838]GGL59237.1 hypothetical protein GCM10011392_12160 [Wenxinia marina]
MANGVESRDWGSYPSSITFNVKGPRGGGGTYAACDGYPAGEPEVACSCTGQESGTVWGSGPYTADSDICTAALHSGYIDNVGGPVFAVGTSGLDSYRGSELNGVTTRDWGSYGTSFVFDWNR